MKNLRLLYLSMIAITIVLQSCGSDDDTPTTDIPIPEPPRADGRQEFKIERISDLYGVWKFESITASVPVQLREDGFRSTDVLLQIPSCFRDNTFTFNFDDSYAIGEGDKRVCDSDGKIVELDPPNEITIRQGVYDIDINSDENDINATASFNPTEDNIPSEQWVNLIGLKDTINTNKRYIEFISEPEGLGLDMVGITSFKEGTTRIVLVSDN